MTSALSYIEYLNNSTTTGTPTILDMVSTVAVNADRSTYPCSVGNYSMSKVFKLSFGGSFTGVYNLRMYKSDGAYVTGETLSYGCSTSYSVPTGGSYQDTHAATAIPTTDPGVATPNITIGGTTSGTITATSNTTDYIFLQSSISIQSGSGTTNSKILTFTWQEN